MDQNNFLGLVADVGSSRLTSTPMPGVNPLGKFEGLGPLGEIFTSIGKPLSLVNKVFSILIGVITALAFLYFIFAFFSGGLSWVTSGGDSKSIEAAQKKITTALVGLVLVVAAIFLIQILGTILGIDILNPFGFIIDIWQP